MNGLRALAGMAVALAGLLLLTYAAMLDLEHVSEVPWYGRAAALAPAAVLLILTGGLLVVA